MPELILGLDGAFGRFSVALIAADGSLAPRVAAGEGNDALERGLSLVESVLDGLPVRALWKLAVGTGPGSFTGLRIALAFAKGLAYSAGVPLVGISSYDAVEPLGSIPPVAAFVTGRAGLACVRLRLASETLVRCGPHSVLADAIAERVPAGTPLAIAGAAEGVAPALGERGVIVRASSPVAEPPALVIARRAVQAVPASSPHAVRADYGELVAYTQASGDA